MRRHYLTYQLLFAGFLLLTAGSNSLAVTVTLNGNQVFHDNFESRTPGATFGVPTPATANWALNFRNGNNVSISDALTPGAAEGSQYGRLERTVGNRSSYAMAQFNVPVVDGDQLHAEWMMYIPAGQPQFGFNGGFEDVSENRPVAIASGTDGDVFALNEGLFWSDTGLDFAFDTWQKWEQDWVVGSANMAITVAGTSITVGNADPGGAEITCFYLSTVVGSDFYVDAVPAAATAVVPEPASAPLIAAGVAVAASFRRRIVRQVAA
ncbi:PEP-CTERM sorting domain-containing protein [Lacipirellula parvula]|uniref:PEP-CTERM protein-sorting domain-containing protein n=1 Tax=Lacipirellula parvula TaxID=2650471 RepID=A0A5K7XA90_9BACT|nr:PEP-CTERM sorting domain-containing protein [Lacipirellula parvula]BBO33620.1 hypothetical protein PLANPX_3232 [Lacipirellula parvula]